MRSGFSLLMALLFLVLIATISALSLSLSTQSVKQTSDIHFKNQAELLLRSGTEFALLAMSGHDYANDGCISNINIMYPNNNPATHTHDININIMYIGNSFRGPTCIQLGRNIDTNESNRTVIIDTFVSTNPLLTTNGVISEQIRMHRRSIQKP